MLFLSGFQKIYIPLEKKINNSSLHLQTPVVVYVEFRISCTLMNRMRVYRSMLKLHCGNNT